MEGQKLYDLMRERRSCRSYKSEQVPVDLLDQVLQAGRIAPSGMNVRQCHFIAVRRPELLEKVRVLLQQIFADMETASASPMLSRTIELAKKDKHCFFYSAPTLIVVANQRDNVNNLADSAVALQNMMLMATALGLGSCWINNLRWQGDVPSIRQFLEEIGVKEHEAVYGALALGYIAAPLPEAPACTGNITEILE
jgi:nitroreductase